MNVSSWDEERLFVQPFIWQRNCKKRDLFNGSFSSQLGALVGCNGLSNDWDTLILTDLDINCLSPATPWLSPPSTPSSSPPHNGRLLSRLNLPKNSVVFLSLGQKGANENLLCFNYVFWPALCPVVDGQHKNICYTSIPQSRPQHTWRQANVINIRRAATSWWTGEWAVSSQYCVMMGSAGTIYHQERDDLDIGGSAHWRAVTIQSRHL